MRTTLACLSLSLALFAPACTSDNGAPDDDELLTRRMQWSRPGHYEYSFTWHRTCFCVGDGVRPIRIHVEANAIKAAEFVDDHQPVGEFELGELRTISGVFDLVQEAIDRDAHEITVAFDPTYGFPTSVFIDYKARLADEELTLKLSDFQSETDVE